MTVWVKHQWLHRPLWQWQCEWSISDFTGHCDSDSVSEASVTSPATVTVTVWVKRQWLHRPLWQWQCEWSISDFRSVTPTRGLTEETEPCCTDWPAAEHADNRLPDHGPPLSWWQRQSVTNADTDTDHDHDVAVQSIIQCSLWPVTTYTATDYKHRRWCGAYLQGSGWNQEEGGGAGPSSWPRRDPEQGGGAGLRKLDFRFRFGLFLNSSATDIVTLPKHGSWNTSCSVHKSLGNGEGTDTALTLPLFWRRSTVSPVFFGRYPQSSVDSLVPPPPPPPPPHPRPRP